MSQPLFMAADYTAALQALLPRGRVWPKDLSALQTALCAGLAPSLERVDAEAQFLLQDTFPTTAVEMLPEWEESTGLPDPCAGEAPTLQQRQAQVGARVANAGGQSAAFFRTYAANLGYQVTVQTFGPFRVSQAAVGMPVADVAWAWAWAITAPLNSVTYFEAGRSAVGEPLAAWGNTVLQCELSTIQPAYGQLIFQYR